jgi:hypothetical protein
MVAKIMHRKSQKGFALIEAVAFLMAFVILLVFTVDTFTAIHTGIVNSIGARTYAFQTFSHRADLRVFRESLNPDPGQKLDPGADYSKLHERFHATVSEVAPPDEAFGYMSGRRLTQVREVVRDMPESRNPFSGKNKTSSIQIKTGYGICVDAKCGG